MFRNKDYLRLKALVEDHLPAFLPEIDNNSITLYDSMLYSVTASGKRLRPVLLLAAAEFCSQNPKHALPYACSLEYIHTYSLIHDDLPAMDNDDMRRGKPTNHMVYGENIAILAGDALLTAAFEVMMKDMLLYFDNTDELKKRVRAVYEIAKGAGCRGMVAGQLADIESEGKICSRDLLDYIHLNKTAALITAAIKAGAHLGDAGSEKLSDLSDYGECIGLAFQIADDLLDICGDEDLMGKKTGKDKERCKCTYPSVYGMSEAKKKLFELTDKAIDTMKIYYDDAEFFTALAIQLADRVK